MGIKKVIMKHLKPYKIFESNDNFLLDCQDILLELKDNGFDVQFRMFNNTNVEFENYVNPWTAEINISKRDESMFPIVRNNIYTFGEISETILRLNDFLKSNNKRATAYESTEYSELDDVIKTWGKDYRLRRLTIYLRK